MKCKLSSCQRDNINEQIWVSPHQPRNRYDVASFSGNHSQQASLNSPDYGHMDDNYENSNDDHRCIGFEIPSGLVYIFSIFAMTLVLLAVKTYKSDSHIFLSERQASLKYHG